MRVSLRLGCGLPRGAVLTVAVGKAQWKLRARGRVAVGRSREVPLIEVFNTW